MNSERKIGVWTPWAEVLCSDCHGPKNQRTGKPMKWARVEGDGPGYCTKCGCEIWVHQEVALLTAIRHAMGAGDMQQTGGMCSALSFTRPDGGYVIVTAECGFTIGRYTKQGWEESGDCEACYGLFEDTPTEKLFGDDFMGTAKVAIQAAIDGKEIPGARRWQ